MPSISAANASTPSCGARFCALAGGRRAAILYTLIRTATLVDPEAYLRDVLARIADHPINSSRWSRVRASRRTDELLPWTWATSQCTAAAA